MSDDIASLGIKVDATQVTPAATQLDTLTAAGDRAEASTLSLTDATRQLTDAQRAGLPVTSAQIQAVGGWANAQKILQSATTQTATSVAAATKLNAAATATGVANFRTLAQGINASAGISEEAIKSAAASYAVFGKSLSGLSAIHHASTVAQIEDEAAIATATAVSATEQVAANEAVKISAVTVREALVAVREIANGNYTRLGGTLSILAGQFGLLSASALAVEIPLLAVLAIFAAIEIAASKSEEASRKLQNEISGIGRVSGVTMQQVDVATKQASASQQVSIATAQEWASAYVATGKIAGDVLIGLTGDTEKYAQATGQTATEANKKLAAAFADPGKGAKELNDQLEFLSATELAHIERMAAEGDRLGAQKALYEDLNKTLDNTAQVHVQGLIASWQGVERAASDAWHAMVIAAGGGTLFEQLASAKGDVQTARDQGEDAPSVAMYQKKVDDLQQIINDQAKKNANASLTAQANIASQNGLATASSINPELTALDELIAKRKALNAALDDHTQSIAKDSAATVAADKQTLQAVVDTIGRVTDANGKYITQAERQHQIDVLKASDAATTDKAEKGRIVTQIKLLEAGGKIITNQQALTQATDAGNIVADKATKVSNTKVDSAQRQLDVTSLLLTQQNDLNAKVQAGTITATEAEHQITATANARRIEAIADGASGAVKAKLLAILPLLIKADTDLTASRDIAKLQQENQSEEDRNSILTKQISLAGQANDVRAVTIAQYAKTLELRARGGDTLVNSAEGQQAISDAGQNATLSAQNQITNSVANDNENKGDNLGVTALQAANVNLTRQYQIAKNTVLKYYADLAKARSLNADDEAAKQKALAALDQQQLDIRLSATADFFGALASLSDTKSKEINAIAKAAAIVQAGINAYLAYSKALADPSLPYPSNYIAAGAALIAGLAAEAKIAGLQGGGYTGDGPVDQAAGIVHGQEFVVHAKATAENRPLLEAMNRGAKPLVSNVPSPANSNVGIAGGNHVNIVIEDHGTKKSYTQVPGITPGEVRMIAQDVVAKKTPDIMARELSNVNSKSRRSLSQHTTTQNKRPA